MLHNWRSPTAPPQDEKASPASADTTAVRRADSKEEVAESWKTQGTAALEAGSYRKAAELYTRALTQTPGDWTLLANRSQAFLRGKEYRAAIYDATAALRINPTHLKSWYRRGTARNALGLHEAALRDLTVAVLLDPTNRLAQVERAKAAESVRSAGRRCPDVTLPVVESGEGGAQQVAG